MQNREIKFRVWDKSKNKMYLPMANMFLYWGDDGTNLVTELQSADMKYDCSDNEDDCVIMQFSGLHDKNGKGIYEGDICKVYNFDEPNIDTYDVAYDRGSFVFINCLTLAIELRGYKTDYIEIIGNIYENSELLT